MKKRILTGLAPLVVLLVAMSAYAVLLFSELGTSVDVILRENFRSVIAGQQMKEAAERMDSGLAFALAGGDARGRDLFIRNRAHFETAMEAARGNITLPGEQETVAEIEKQLSTYTAQTARFWSSAMEEERNRLYFEQLLPVFTRMKDGAQKVIDLNQANMLAADRQARELAAHSTRNMLLAGLLGVAAAIFFAVRLLRAILQPIQALTVVSQELGEGKLDQVVPVRSQDELGQLANAFNKMAAKLRVYRQASTEELEQARQMTETTFSAFPDPILILSRNAAIQFANPAAGTLLQKITRLPAALQDVIGHVLAGAPDYLPTSFAKTEVVRVDDQERFLLPRVIAIRGDAGQPLGAAVVLQDVTRLRLMDEVKSHLVSTVSHELKTPLTSVRMGLHLLLEERIGSLNPKQLELLLAAREDSERLLTMINDLLDLARLEAGNAVQRRATVHASTLLRSAAADMEAYAHSRGTALRSLSAHDAGQVNVDPEQLAHVFSNLITNAVKHTPPGDEVILSATRLEGKVRFSVSDHGPGIASQFQPHVFERFFRMPGEESKGAGLGLAIAREIVTAHGGTMGVTSAPGEGAEFYFDLPSVSAPHSTSRT